MQGRLTPRSTPRLQTFPGSGWPREFTEAALLGFEFVEWLAGSRDERNALFTLSGRREIRAVASRTGVAVGSVCAAGLIARPLAGVPIDASREATIWLRRTIEVAAAVGATRVVVPWIEESALRTSALEDEAVANLSRCVDTAERHGVTLALEMDVAGPEYARIVRRLDHPRVRACYDMGNSTAAGHDIVADVRHVLPVLDEIHVKDRHVGGESRPLGRGDADFRGFFGALAEAGFDGDLVLEHWFDEPIQDASRSLAFVRQWIDAPAGRPSDREHRAS